MQQRWWTPGAVVAAGAVVVVWLATAGWYGFEDGDCGKPGAKFACLVESLVAAGLVLLLGPLLLWWAYRAAGVRRALLSTVVAAAVLLALGVLPVLVEHAAVVAGVADVRGTSGRYPAALVAVVAGLAVLGGGLVFHGPYRRRRAGVAAVALVAAIASAAALQAPAERADERLELQTARVPLLLPAQPWQQYSPNAGPDGDLRYDAVPAGWDGYGFEGASVTVSGRTEDFGDTCSFRACADAGDVRYELLDPLDAYSGTTAWRLVDGFLVTVQTHGDMAPDVEPVAFLQGMAEVSVKEFIDRRFTDR